MMEYLCLILLTAGAASHDVECAFPGDLGTELPTPRGCGDCLRLGVAAAAAKGLVLLADDGRRDLRAHDGPYVCSNSRTHRSAYDGADDGRREQRAPGVRDARAPVRAGLHEGAGGALRRGQRLPSDPVRRAPKAHRRGRSDR